MAVEPPPTYEIFLADLKHSRSAQHSIITPYTDELQLTTFLVDAWMMKLMPLEIIGEFIKRTNKKMWQEFTGEEDDETAPVATTSATPATVPSTTSLFTPGFGGGSAFNGGAQFSLSGQKPAAAAAPAATAITSIPAKKAEESDDEDDASDGMTVAKEIREWDTIEFTTDERLQIRESVLNALKKDVHRRWFIDQLPYAKRFPYLCVKKGASTHVDVMLEMLRRGSGILF